MRIFTLDGQLLQRGHAFEHNGFRFPENWLELATYEELHAQGIETEEIADPVVPPAVPEVISDRQFFQGLAFMEIITKDEALAAVETGKIPAALQVIVNELPDAGPNDPVDMDIKFSTKMLLSGAIEFKRHHPFTEAVRLARGMSQAEVDEFWRMCATL